MYSYVLEAYCPNSWEYQNIGVNNLSPFPNYYISEVAETPKTIIGQIGTAPKELALNNYSNGVTLTSIISCQKGYTKYDLYYRWEAKVGDDVGEWRTIWYWDPEANQEAYNLPSTDGCSSKGKFQIEITPSMMNALLNNQTPAVDTKIYFRCTATSDFQDNYDLDTHQYTKDKDQGSLNISGSNRVLDWVADEAIGQYSKTHMYKEIRENYYPEYTLQYCREQGWNDANTRYENGYAAPDDQFLHSNHRSCHPVGWTGLFPPWVNTGIGLL